MKRKIIALLLATMMVLSLLPLATMASAVEEIVDEITELVVEKTSERNRVEADSDENKCYRIKYKNPVGSNGEILDEPTEMECPVAYHFGSDKNNNDEKWDPNGGSYILDKEWYFIDENWDAGDKYRGSFEICGNVNFILKDGVTLNLQGYSGNDNAALKVQDERYSLTIWAQSTGSSAGTIKATGVNGGAAIGGDSGNACHNLTINGGNIEVTADRGAGIGGGSNAGCVNLVINGGNIKAKSDYGAGIGTGKFDNTPGFIETDVEINGGTVDASASWYGAGIGGGQNCYGGTGKGGFGKGIVINGGNVTAKGGQEASGIGGGKYELHTNNWNDGRRTKVTINGGTVNATGGSHGYAIGGGSIHNNVYDNHLAEINLYGGDITATSGYESDTIGGYCIDDYDNTTRVRIEQKTSTPLFVKLDTKDNYGYQRVIQDNVGLIYKVYGVTDKATLISPVSGPLRTIKAQTLEIVPLSSVVNDNGETVEVPIFKFDANYRNKIYNSEGPSYFYVKGRNILPDLKIEGDIRLLFDSKSQLLCEGTSGHPGIEVPEGSSLYMTGVTGVQLIDQCSIIAIGAENCAGIGGKDGESCGKIVMNHVHLLAAGGTNAAGIGGGNGGDGKDIVINDSNVNAIPSTKLENALLNENQDDLYSEFKGERKVLLIDTDFKSSSIGGGNGGNEDGDNGNGGNGTNISVCNSSLGVIGSRYAAGIGGGYYGEADGITLKDCKIGYPTFYDARITLSSVTENYIDMRVHCLYGNDCNDIYYAFPNLDEDYSFSIGGGYHGDGKNITIYGGSIEANGIGNSAAIGGGEEGNGENITIYEGSEDAEYSDGIFANGTYYSAGIGGGKGGDAKNIIINSSLNASGRTGIGAGLGGVADGITINQGNILVGGIGGASIGGGGLEISPQEKTVDAKNIYINGGNVTTCQLFEEESNENNLGANIGSGYGCCSNGIYINGGYLILGYFNLVFGEKIDKFYIGSAQDAKGLSENIYLKNRCVYTFSNQGDVLTTNYNFENTDCSDSIDEINELFVAYLGDKTQSYYDPESNSNITVPCMNVVSGNFTTPQYSIYLYVEGEQEFSSQLDLSYKNVILADGAKLIVNVDDDDHLSFRNTTIYGQENGTGILEVNYSDSKYAINIYNGETVINGGIVNINAEDGSKGFGIKLPKNGKLTVNYGELNVNVADGNCIGTDSEDGLGTLEVNGGKVSLSTENGKAVALGGSQTMDGIFVDTNMYIFADESANPTIARCLNRTANQNISSNIAFQMKNVLIVSKNDDSAVFPALFSVVTDSATLLSALETVQNGETITLGSDMNLNDETVRVQTGQTLDLNGHNLGCKYLIVNGNVIDTSENKAVLKVETFSMPESGDYLPIYNEEAGGYSFYAMKVNVYRNKTNPNKFGFRFDTSGNPGSEDYDLAKELFGNTDESIKNAKIKAVVTFKWTDGGKEKKVPVSFDLALIQSYLKKDNGILTITVNGLETIESDINVDFAFVALDKDGNEITSVKTPITIEKTVSEVSL